MTEYSGKNFQLIESIAQDLTEEELDALMTRLLAGEVFGARNPFRPSGLMKLKKQGLQPSRQEGEEDSHYAYWVDLWQLRDRFAEYLPVRAEPHWPYVLIIDREKEIGVEIYWDQDGYEVPRIIGRYQGQALQKRINSDECWVEENRYLAANLYRDKTRLREVPETLWLEISLVLIDVFRRSKLGF